MLVRLDSQRGCDRRTIGGKYVRGTAKQVKLEVVRFLAGSRLCNHRMQDHRRAGNCPLMPGGAALMTRWCRSRRRGQMAVTSGKMLHLTRRIRPTGDGKRCDREHHDQHSREHSRPLQHCSMSR